MFLALSSAYRLVLDKIHDDQLQKEKENENLKTELSFLRSQISPHFIFNVLNNTVSLARKKSDLVEPTLVQLSNLLRYMLYESEYDKVPFEKELEYVNSYLELQKLRFGDDTDIVFDCDCDNSIQFIEPMLIIPLIENAFKHGIASIERPEIVIALSEKEKGLNLLVTNKFNKHLSEIKDGTSGIGLKNLQRRLALLYGTSSNLSIREAGDYFIVNLKIST